ncbi:MAG TPA: Uma2 family endonuclease [Isosphaeraceae bacterium]|jgi:Uma2 family endonuclease|nr:Uma2 family endonuclease [Isosphaeraceae bacterium]
MSSLIDARPARLRDTEFFAMVESGAFGDRRVYLWNGRLCEKMAKSTQHAFVNERISRAVRALLPDTWETWHENPVHLGRWHVPLPDFAVVRGPLDRYRDRGPEPADVGLVVEVAVTSLKADLGKRADRYAQFGVPSYWVADVGKGQIVEHRRLVVTAGVASYGDVRRLGASDEVELALGGAAVGRIPMTDIF